MAHETCNEKYVGEQPFPSEQLVTEREDAAIPRWYYRDNGFESRSDMDDAQEPVVDFAVSVLAKTESPAKVIDLGCGNGVLLKKIYERCPHIEPHGIDKAPFRLEHAKASMPDYAKNFVMGDSLQFNSVFPNNKEYSVALIGIDFFIKMDEAIFATFSGTLKKYCQYVILYNYDNYDIKNIVTKYMKLKNLTCGKSDNVVAVKF
jgi:SAM-dependent methyltransferase